MRAGIVSSDQLRKPIHGGDSTSLHARHHLPLSREQELEALAYELGAYICVAAPGNLTMPPLTQLPEHEQDFVRHVLRVTAYRLNLQAKKIRNKGTR